MAAAVGVMFMALAFTGLGVVAALMLSPGIWEGLVGPSGAVVAAVLTMAGVVWGAARLMRVADRLMGETSHRSGPALAPARSELSKDWKAYNEEIVRNKRWAFYRRTRQFDRLVELEEELRSERARATQN